VLRTVHRIRKVEERVARVVLFEADEARARTAADLAHIERKMVASWERADEAEIVSLAGHHAEALRLELRRRSQTRDLAEKDRTAEAARAAVRHCSTQARVFELAADAREEAANHALARVAMAATDEAGLFAWHRRSA